MKKEVLEAIALLIGTVIGAGVLGIPYVVSKAGFLTGLLVIIVLGISILLINLLYGEVILRTKGNHQLDGYAKRYLGKWGNIIAILVMVFGIYGALLAYVIGVGQSFNAIFGFSAFAFSLIFFIVMAILIYIGLDIIDEVELLMVGFLILIIILVAVFSFSRIDISNLMEFDISKVFIPYGVILFAFLGAASIPEMKEEITRNRKELKKAILIGSLIPLVLYILFAFTVVGVSGKDVTQIATIGLGQLLGWKMILFGNLFAIFAMSGSFLTLGLALREFYDYDQGLHKSLAWFLTMIVPLLLFLFLRGYTGFKDVLNFTGIFAGGLEGILIVFMFWKAKKVGDRKPEYTINKSYILGGVLMLIFVLGMIFGLR